MSNWWDTWKKTLAGIVVAILIGVGTWLSNQGNTITTNGGDANVHQGTGDINTGDTHTTNIYITLEAYELRLKRRKSEVLAELEHADVEDRQVLELELSDIQQQLQNKTASYEAHITGLIKRIAQLEKLRGEFPDKLLDQAIEALRQGKNEEADRLFQQIEEDGEKHIKRVAEAAYQRGKIAKGAIRYTEALEHYDKAVRLQPDNALYLNEAGVLYLRLANYLKAIKYFELALASNLKTYGDNHPDVATYRSNLGLAWDSLGEYKKGIEYFELALASNLKTYGENHPDVATRRNNLGMAWNALGEHHKAIQFYELALTIFEQSLGKDHPNTQTVRSNLDETRTALKQSQ